MTGRFHIYLVLGILIFSECLIMQSAYGLDCTFAVNLGCRKSVSVGATTEGKPASADVYSCVSWPETGPEGVYIITPNLSGDITATLSMMSVNLDVFILTDCDESTCVAYGDTVATLPGASPGTYYVIVDGYDGAEGLYRLDLTMGCAPTPTPTDTPLFTPTYTPTWTPTVTGTWFTSTPTFTNTPTNTRTNTPTRTPFLTSTPRPTRTPTPTPAPNLDCSDAVDLGCVSSILVTGDTTGKVNNVPRYNCTVWPELGPEDVYIIRPDGPGDISAMLTSMSADLDVFILTDCNEFTCVAFGNNSANYSFAPAGTYYIVVDGFNGAAGSYHLTVSMNCSTTPTPTPTGSWFTATPTNTSTVTNTPTWTASPTATPTLPPHVIPFCDDFESGTLDNWTVNAGSSGDLPFASADSTLSGTLTPHGGSWVAFLGDETDGGTATATIDLIMNLAGETNVLLDFYWVTFSLEFDQFIYLDIFDGTWHTNVLRFQGTRWQHQSVDLDADYMMIDGFIIRFRSYVDFSEDFDATYVDDVCVFDPSAPTATVTPTPTNTPSPVPSENHPGKFVLAIILSSLMIMIVYRVFRHSPI